MTMRSWQDSARIHDNNDYDMKIAVIGAGNMGSAVVAGIAATLTDVEIAVSNPSQGKLDRLKSRFPAITTTRSNTDACAGASVIILAVKPWILPGVIDELRPAIEREMPAVVSMAGGIGLDDLEGMLGEGCHPALFYVIPNTAAAVGESMTFMAQRRADEVQVAAVMRLFGACGKVAMVEERMMNAGMVTASCGIAFVMRYMRAMEQGAVELGLRPAEARRAIVQTVLGAAKLLESTGAHPEDAIDAVTTAGGLTIRGLNAMETGGLSAAVEAGMRAGMPVSK